MIHRTLIQNSQALRISSFLPAEPFTEAPTLPDFLLRLSDKTMRNMQGRDFVPDSVVEAPHPSAQFGGDSSTLSLDSASHYRTISITPVEHPNRVVAVDVSSIKLGETADGVLSGIRGAFVWRDSSGYRSLRYGPLCFHVNEQTERELTQLLGLSKASANARWFSYADRLIIRVRNLLERWIQLQACLTFDNCAVLFDGSLTAGTPDNPARQVERILETARQGRNVVLAFSKATKLRANGTPITELGNGYRAPCLVDVDGAVSSQFPAYPVRLLGKVYVSKLQARGFLFRLDVDREITEDQALQALGSIASIDLVEHGYPETLRYAHIVSTFTANEVIAIQSHVAGHYGLRTTNPINVRRSLFGPFGTGREVAQ